MEFRVDLPAALPDPAQLSRLLGAADPSAVADLDPLAQAWRVNTVLEARDLVALLASAGCAVAPAAVTRLPSVCCGGCSG